MKPWAQEHSGGFPGRHMCPQGMACSLTSHSDFTHVQGLLLLSPLLGCPHACCVFKHRIWSLSSPASPPKCVTGKLPHLCVRC